MTTFTRLHITPFAPDLARAVLGANVVQLAQNISYHNIETFPENHYGFVDLPSKDAQALTKKLNGAILRGRKMKVEEARSKKRKHVEVEAGDSATGKKQRTRSPAPRKAKQSKDMLEGRELSPDRKVKRGWTEPTKDKERKKRPKDEKIVKPQQRSKYTDDEELLFRTRVPLNKSDPKKKDKAKRKDNKNHVVHEFSQSTKQSSFLRTSDSDTRPITEYVEGTGWVDREGNVVEPGATPQQLKRRMNKQLGIDVEKAQSRAPVTRSVAGQDQNSAVSQQPTNPAQEEDTSSSGSSTDGDDETSSTSSDSEVGDITGTPEKVHPLEALFKKPSLPSTEEIAKPSLEIETGFSFFGQENADLDDILDVPTTPFTANEIHTRGTRSAAPTPDTAHPSRFASFESALNSTSASDRASSAGLDQEVRATESESKTESQTSDFEKKFWEMRGDNNRSWKARRRAALKEQRQKENKARRPKNW